MSGCHHPVEGGLVKEISNFYTPNTYMSVDGDHLDGTEVDEHWLGGGHDRRSHFMLASILTRGLNITMHTRAASSVILCRCARNLEPTSLHCNECEHVIATDQVSRVLWLTQATMQRLQQPIAAAAVADGGISMRQDAK